MYSAGLTHRPASSQSVISSDQALVSWVAREEVGFLHLTRITQAIASPG